MTLTNYKELLDSKMTPTPYPYGGEAVSTGWDGGDFSVRVLNHKKHADCGWVVLVEGEGFARRWTGAEMVLFPAPLLLS